MSVLHRTNTECSVYLEILKEFHFYTKIYGPLRGPTLAEAFFALRAKNRVYYAVLTHFRPFLVSSSNLVNWMSVRTQFGHGRTRLSVRAHFGYGQTNLKKSLFSKFNFCRKKRSTKNGQKSTKYWKILKNLKKSLFFSKIKNNKKNAQKKILFS